MHLPWSRPRLFELADQPLCPSLVRQAVQSTLTFLWTHRIPPFQSQALYERVAEILEELVDELQLQDEELGLRIVDCCSGGGGPMPAIEGRIKLVLASQEGEDLWDIVW